MLLGGRPTLEPAEELARRGCAMGYATGGGRHATGVPFFLGGSTSCIPSVGNRASSLSIIMWGPPFQWWGTQFIPCLQSTIHPPPPLALDSSPVFSMKWGPQQCLFC